MRAVALAGVLAALVLAAAQAGAQPAPPSPWDGVNPFACELQQAGAGVEIPHPDADPLCIEYDKRRQNVTELGVVEFLSMEPARVALASDKCFYFQSDHWRGSVVQEDGSTKTYEWDGHYFFDKATGDGGVWVTNFNVNGHTGDPTAIPGFPPEYAQHFGPGTGGMVSHNAVEADPRCAEKARRDPPYAPPPVAERPAECSPPRGGAARRRLGGVRLGMTEEQVYDRLGRPASVKRGFLRYCLSGGGELLVGVPGDRSGSGGEPGSGRAVFLVTTHRGLEFRGIGRGDTLRDVRRAFPRARRWFGVRGARVLRLRRTVALTVRDRRVRRLAVFDARRVRGAGAARRWLRRSA